MSAVGHGLAARLLTGTPARVALHDPPLPEQHWGGNGTHRAPRGTCLVVHSGSRLSPGRNLQHRAGRGNGKGPPSWTPPLLFFAAHPLPRGHFCCSHRSHHR